MPRINVFENYNNAYNVVTGLGMGNNSLQIQVVNIPGSLSFNNIAVLLSASGTTAKTASISFGLYSLNGATLSLANSASGSTKPVTDQLSWISLATSATQDITPGNWYFAMMSATSSNSRMTLVCNQVGAFISDGGNGGPFFLGWATASQSDMPASIATSDLAKAGSTAGGPNEKMYYILISA